MRKNMNPIDEILVETNSFPALENNLPPEDFLLFITRFGDLRLQAQNLKAQNHFKDIGSAANPASDFFKKVVHPEDYAAFLSTMFSGEPPVSGEENQLQARIIDKEGEWQEFLFKGRPYGSEKFGEEKHVLLMGVKADRTEFAAFNGADTASENAKRPQGQDKYHVLLNSIDEAYVGLEILIDIEGHPVDFLILEHNSAFEDHVQLRNPTGKTLRELLPEHQEQWLTTYSKVAMTGEPARFQGDTSPLGETWLDISAFCLGEKEERRMGILFSNITDQKIAEEKLKKTNGFLEQQVEERTRQIKSQAELLQDVFDTTNEGIMILEPLWEQNNSEIVDFRYLKLNKIIEQQHKQGQLEGKRFLQVTSNLQKNELFKIFRNVLHEKGHEDFEFPYDADGDSRWFRITARNRNGLLIVSAEDITNRKLEAERLKESIKFKKLLTRASPDIIMIFNIQEQQIQYMNRDLSSHPGMKKNEILGKSIDEVFTFVHPRDREYIRSFHDRLLQASNSDVTETEFRLRGTSNNWEWFNAVGKVFKRDGDKKVSEYLILLRNIEEQKRTQKALLRAEKLSIKGEVARTLAHELRNPLASIGMAADVLKTSLPKEKKQELENYLDIIGRSTQVLNDLVTDLLTSSNYTPPVLERHCLASILEETLQLAGDRIYLTGIRVVRKYKGRYHINADAEKLKIALLNIIINASEAMDPNEGVLRLKITKEDDYFVLTIKDNGHGLEKEQLDKLFDAFYSEKAGGVGVGLSSVKNILEEHDALIKVDSKPRKGTCFRLSFQCYEVFERS